MKTRRIKVDEQGNKHIVWFGSYGVIKNLNVIFNFDNAYISSAITYSNFISLFGNGEYLKNLECSYVRYGDSTQQNVTGLLFGTSSADAVATFTFSKIVKTITLYVTNYKNTNTTLIVNGQYAYPTHSQDEEPQEFTFEVNSNVITIESNDVGTPTDERMWLKKMVVSIEQNAAKFYNSNDKHDNYATKQQSVVDGLIQRLSVIKGELWYKINEGVPLFDKYRSKGIMDAELLSIIMKHPEVKAVLEFSSTVNNTSYSCTAKIVSIYGEIEVNL